MKSKENQCLIKTIHGSHIFREERNGKVEYTVYEIATGCELAGDWTFEQAVTMAKSLTNDVEEYKLKQFFANNNVAINTERIEL